MCVRASVRKCVCVRVFLYVFVLTPIPVSYMKTFLY